jgi:hypothetical protein
MSSQVNTEQWSISYAEKPIEPRPFWERPGRNPRHGFLAIVDEAANRIVDQLHVIGRNAHGQLIRNDKARRTLIFNNAASFFGLGTAFNKAANIFRLEDYILFLRAERGHTSMQELSARVPLIFGPARELYNRWQAGLEAAVILNKLGIPYRPLGTLVSPGINCKSGAALLIKAMDLKIPEGYASLKLLPTLYEKFLIAKGQRSNHDIHAPVSGTNIEELYSQLEHAFPE